MTHLQGVGLIIIAVCHPDVTKPALMKFQKCPIINSSHALGAWDELNQLPRAILSHRFFGFVITTLAQFRTFYLILNLDTG